jgi:hypothetical protein
MAGPLVNTDYVALIGNRTLTGDETTRASGLIPIASNLVRGEFKKDYSSTTAPEAARLAVARLVLSVLDQDAENLRAEQIGDYRAEFQRGDAKQLMDVSIIADLVRGKATTSRSIRVNLPLDGVDE